MGWLWSSSSDSQESKTLSTPDVPAAQGTPSPSSMRTPPSHPSHEKPLSRDELAEAEFQAMISGLSQSNDESSTQTSNRYSARSASTTFASQTAPSTSSNSAPSSIHPRDLVPKEMSCRSSFDYAFFCQSFGGQWVNIYRYGELRDCSERWSDFWFCMRTMSYPTEQRERMIADYHRKKLEDKYKGKPSSEDVWEMRTVPLRGAFEGDFLALEREMKVTEGKGIDSQGATR